MLDEARRLRALKSYDILDTPPEPQFDRIAELVCRVCAAPFASLTFAETHRHWHKARVGIEASEVLAEDSICLYALDMDDLLIIDDLSADQRTSRKSYVAGSPWMRFYAGAPLRSPEGLVIGTLCALDYKPRPGGLSPEQRDTLLALARHTMAALWLRAVMIGRLHGPQRSH